MMTGLTDGDCLSFTNPSMQTLATNQMHTAQPSSSLRGMVADDDAGLMLKYAAGDMAAFEQLYGRHKAALYRYLQRLCRDADLANDVFQETWGNVIDARTRYDARSQFKTYLFRIAHNCAVDHLRRLNRWTAREGTDIDAVAAFIEDNPQQRPEQQLSASQFSAEFQAALHALPDEQRAAFVLHEESGLPLTEIAAITHCNTETAKSRLRYAIKKLRQSLANYDPAEQPDAMRTASAGGGSVT
jgi:RNA polymerase sigma-70 factor (ECF subfamily)